MGVSQVALQREEVCGALPGAAHPLRGWREVPLAGVHFQIPLDPSPLSLHASPHHTEPPLPRRGPADRTGEGRMEGSRNFKQATGTLLSPLLPPAPPTRVARGQRSEAAARRAHLPGASPPSGTSGSGRRDSACAASCRSCSSGSRCTCSACCSAPCA